MMKKIRVASLLLLSTTLLGALTGFAQKKNTAVKATVSATQQVTKFTGPLPIDKDVKIGKLANGLTYYIRKNVEPQNRAVLYMAVKAGSLQETDAQQGLAHFTEHMAFNGTKDFPKNELINYLQKAGIKFGAELNAYTGFDRTVYQLPIPTDSAELFKNGFKILANWAGHMTMDGKEIDAERGVIVEEDRQRGKNAQSRMSDQLLPVILKGSHYLNRLPIGKMDIVQNFDHSEIKNFFKDWYRPDLQSVIAVGDFDPAEVEQLIKENFGGLKNPANPKKRLTYGLPDNKTPKFVMVTDVEFPYHMTLVSFRHHAKSNNTVEDVRQGVIVSYMNNMIARRLTEIVQKGNAPFLQGQISYGAFQGGMIKDLNEFNIVAVGKSAEDLVPAFNAVMTEVQRMVKHGFTAAELEVLKKALAAGNEQGYKERSKISSSAYVETYLGHFLNNSPIISSEYNYELVKFLLDDIKLEDVNAFASKVVREENITIIVQGPEKDKAALPNEATMLQALRNASKDVAAYQDEVVDEPLFRTTPKAGKIVSEKKIEKMGITELTLSNGVKVVLKPTDFKNDQINMHSFSQGGISIAEDADLISLGYTANIASDGIGAYSAMNLGKYLAGNTAGVKPYLNQLYQGFSGGTAPKDLETMFKLVYAYATDPRKDEVVFKKNLDNYKISLRNAEVSPVTPFKDTLTGILSSYSPRSKKMLVENVDKISLDKSYEFYKQRFADLSGQTFVFVGNFDVDSIKPLLELYLGGLPAAGKPEKFVDRGVKPLTGKVERNVYKGIEDKAEVQLFFHAPFEYNSVNTMNLSALKEVLNNKVMERLREKESGVYSPNVGLAMDRTPSGYYRISVSFSCLPANVDKLIAATLDEIELIKKDGIDPVEIQKFKAETTRSWEVSMRDNGFWLNFLTTAYVHNNDVLGLYKREEILNAVTHVTVQDAAKRFLDGTNYIRVVLLPEQKNEQ